MTQTGQVAKWTGNQLLDMSVYISRGAISWRSKKQSAVTTSKSGVEYLPLGAPAQEGVWLGRIFAFAKEGLDILRRVPTKVDNQGSMKMSKNGASGNRAKDIDINYYLV